VLAIALLAGLAGCTPNQNPEEVKERWSRDKPLNLNAATKEQLMALPGITAAEPDKVIAGRPY
jgi:DNA uptake protein ComE-like DNA-binding protein